MVSHITCNNSLLHFSVKNTAWALRLIQLHSAAVLSDVPGVMPCGPTLTEWQRSPGYDLRSLCNLRTYPRLSIGDL